MVNIRAGIKSLCTGRSTVLCVLLLTLAKTPGQTVYEPGHSYFGHGEYIEYIAGDMPLILSVPHGDTLEPAAIPNRKAGEFESDWYTGETARMVGRVVHDHFGHYPHLILCRLVRVKVDCNREVGEGAGEDPGAIQAWKDFQGFIEQARTNVMARFGQGLYIDLHGQNHPIRRVELGYCLTAGDLTHSDDALNEGRYAEGSTLCGLAHRTPLPFAELLRGSSSLGGLLAGQGYPAVPSPAMPGPGAANLYFDGGYNARKHGSVRGGAVDGVHMGLNYAGIRDSALHRTNFSLALAQVLHAYLTNFYGFNLKTNTVGPARP